MSAPTHSRPHPAASGGAGHLLPWWALVLPTLAFISLLVLILNPADAQAAGGDPAITHLVERVQQLIGR
ncbi:hypothetical protein ACWGH3_34080 [Streptomyces sp. NPDC054884]|uniref:hypothetical protein n=1 Tax=unclassified Streptomyces TaxID=2593676 RepID=UPI0029BF4B38|nr:hypothetical protein [Streptomyces sp. ME08-AFT2]MDX3312665.1 hypothetical protein [Streptomyces sp. ME08-AFT2]